MPGVIYLSSVAFQKQKSASTGFVFVLILRSPHVEVFYVQQDAILSVK